MAAEDLRAARWVSGRWRWPVLAFAAVVGTVGITAFTVPGGGDGGPVPAAPAERVVLSLAGTGPASSAAFATGADWALHFSYSCGNGQATAFRVVERGGAEDGVALADRLAGAGRGTTYAHAAAGHQRLVIETACRWSVTAVDGAGLPRAAEAVSA